MRELTIAGHRIADDTDAWVCAELGSNHGGSVATCKEMIRVAASCGVQAVKMQKRDMATWAERNPGLWESPYNSEHSFGATYGAHRAALEFGWEEYVECKAYAESLGLAFFATAFDVPSVVFLVELGVPAIKIASGSITDHKLLMAAESSDIPLIISTGGATPSEVDRAVRRMWEFSRDALSVAAHALLMCTSLYPCPADRLNLRVVETMRNRYPGTVIGFSDHQDGIDMAPVAYAVGARIFEKHVTLSHSMKGSDHAMSLEPHGLEMYVRSLRHAHEALGDGVKRRYEGEAAALVKQGRTDLVGVA